MSENYHQLLKEVEEAYIKILAFTRADQAERINLKDIKEAQGKIEKILGNIDHAQYQGVNIDQTMYYQVKFQGLNREFVYATKNPVNKQDFSKRIKDIVFNPTQYGQIASPINILPDTPLPSFPEGLGTHSYGTAPSDRVKFGTVNPGMGNPFRQRIIPDRPSPLSVPSLPPNQPYNFEGVLTGPTSPGESIPTVDPDISTKINRKVAKIAPHPKEVIPAGPPDEKANQVQHLSEIPEGKNLVHYDAWGHISDSVTKVPSVGFTPIAGIIPKTSVGNEHDMHLKTAPGVVTRPPPIDHLYHAPQIDSLPEHPSQYEQAQIYHSMHPHQLQHQPNIPPSQLSTPAFEHSQHAYNAGPSPSRFGESPPRIGPPQTSSPPQPTMAPAMSPKFPAQMPPQGIPHAYSPQYQANQYQILTGESAPSLMMEKTTSNYAAPHKQTKTEIVKMDGLAKPAIIKGAFSNQKNSHNPFKTVTINPSNPTYTLHQVDPDELTHSKKPSILPSSEYKDHSSKHHRPPYLQDHNPNIPMTYTNNPWIHSKQGPPKPQEPNLPPQGVITVTPPPEAPVVSQSPYNPHRNATFVPGKQTILITPPQAVKEIVQIVDDSTKQAVAKEYQKKSGDPWLNKNPWSNPPTATKGAPATTSKFKNGAEQTRQQPKKSSLSPAKSKDPWENKNPWAGPSTTKGVPPQQIPFPQPKVNSSFQSDMMGPPGGYENSMSPPFLPIYGSKGPQMATPNWKPTMVDPWQNFNQWDDLQNNASQQSGGSFYDYLNKQHSSKISEPALRTSVPLPPKPPQISQNLHTTLVGAFSRTMDMYCRDHPQVLQPEQKKNSQVEETDEWSPNFKSGVPNKQRSKAQSAAKAQLLRNKIEQLKATDHMPSKERQITDYYWTAPAPPHIISQKKEIPPPRSELNSPPQQTTRLAPPIHQAQSTVSSLQNSAAFQNHSGPQILQSPPTVQRAPSFGNIEPDAKVMSSQRPPQAQALHPPVAITPSMFVPKISPPSVITSVQGSAPPVLVSPSQHVMPPPPPTTIVSSRVKAPIVTKTITNSGVMGPPLIIPGRTMPVRQGVQILSHDEEMTYQNNLNNLFNMPFRASRLSFRNEVQEIQPVPVSKGKSRRNRLEESFGDEDSEDQDDEENQLTQPTTDGIQKNSYEQNIGSQQGRQQIPAPFAPKPKIYPLDQSNHLQKQKYGPIINKKKAEKDADDQDEDSSLINSIRESKKQAKAKQNRKDTQRIPERTPLEQQIDKRLKDTPSDGAVMKALEDRDSPYLEKQKKVQEKKQSHQEHIPWKKMPQPPQKSPLIEIKPPKQLDPFNLTPLINDDQPKEVPWVMRPEETDYEPRKQLNQNIQEAEQKKEEILPWNRFNTEFNNLIKEEQKEKQQQQHQQQQHNSNTHQSNQMVFKPNQKQQSNFQNNFPLQIHSIQFTQSNQQALPQFQFQDFQPFQPQRHPQPFHQPHESFTQQQQQPNQQHQVNQQYQQQQQFNQQFYSQPQHYNNPQPLNNEFQSQPIFNIQQPINQPFQPQYPQPNYQLQKQNEELKQRLLKLQNQFESICKVNDQLKTHQQQQQNHVKMLQNQLNAVQKAPKMQLQQQNSQNRGTERDQVFYSAVQHLFPNEQNQLSESNNEFLPMQNEVAQQMYRRAYLLFQAAQQNAPQQQQYQHPQQYQQQQQQPQQHPQQFIQYQPMHNQQPQAQHFQEQQNYPRPQDLFPEALFPKMNTHDQQSSNQPVLQQNKLQESKMTLQELSMYKEFPDQNKYEQEKQHTDNQEHNIQNYQADPILEKKITFGGFNKKQIANAEVQTSKGNINVQTYTQTPSQTKQVVQNPQKNDVEWDINYPKNVKKSEQPLMTEQQAEMFTVSKLFSNMNSLKLMRISLPQTLVHLTKNNLANIKLSFFQKAMAIIKDNSRFMIAFKRSNFNKDIDTVRIIFYVANKTRQDEKAEIMYNYDNTMYEIAVTEKLRSIKAGSQAREELYIRLKSGNKNQKRPFSLITGRFKLGRQVIDLLVPVIFLKFKQCQRKSYGYQQQTLTILPQKQFSSPHLLFPLIPLNCLNTQDEVRYLRGETRYESSVLVVTKNSVHPLQLDWYDGTLSLTGSRKYIAILAWLMADIQL